MTDPDKMSDNPLREFVNEVVKEDELKIIEDENYFAEQDKKFKDLQIKLQQLKDENKRQMDIIINNLDDLIASKSYVEKTLEQVTIDDPGDTNLTENMPDIQSSVVDLLSKVTGFLNETNSLFSDEANDDKLDNQSNGDTKSEEKSSSEEKCDEMESEDLSKSTKLLEDLCINSADVQKSDDKK